MFLPSVAVTRRLCFPADAAGFSGENESASALFEMLGHFALSNAPASKSSCRRTRGSDAMPRSPGYLAAMPSAGASAWTGALAQAGAVSPIAAHANIARSIACCIRHLLAHAPDESGG